MKLWDEFIEAVEQGKAEEASKKAGSDGVLETMVETGKAVGKSAMNPLAWLGDLVPWEAVVDAFRGLNRK